MRYTYIISIVSENTMRAMQRIINIFVFQQVNIEQMNILTIENKSVSHYSIAIQANENVIEKLLKRLRCVIELLEVKISNQIPLMDVISSNTVQQKLYKVEETSSLLKGVAGA